MASSQRANAKLAAAGARKAAAHPYVLRSFPPKASVRTPRPTRTVALADANACRQAQVAVLPGRDHASQAGSRRRCPPPPQAFCGGAVTGCVHLNAT